MTGRVIVTYKNSYEHEDSVEYSDCVFHIDERGTLFIMNKDAKYVAAWAYLVWRTVDVV